LFPTHAAWKENSSGLSEHLERACKPLAHVVRGLPEVPAFVLLDIGEEVRFAVGFRDVRTITADV